MKPQETHRSKFFWNPAAWLIAMLITAIPGVLSAQERPLAERPVPIIQVSGEGEAKLAPDIAIVSAGVVREARTAREALTANNEAMAAVISALKEAGIAERDLQTSSFSIQPRYVYPSAKDGEQVDPRIVGYSVSNRLTVRIRDIEKTGQILDRMVSLGVNSDGNIDFTNDDPSKALSQARALAVKDAAEKARTLADAAGVTLGSVLEITESSGQPRPVAFQRTMAAARSAESVPVQGGENSYNVSVQIRWEITQ